MRRVIVIAAVGLGFGLAGCSSFSLDAFKSTPPNMTVRLESNPPGADAKTSLGPGCKTPCTVQVPAPPAETNTFSVTYTLAKYQPTDVEVQVMRDGGDLTSPPTASTNPNPVVAELQPMAPPPKAAHKPMRPRPKKPKAPKSAAAPAAPADAAFPDPGAGAQPAAPPPPPGNPSR